MSFSATRLTCFALISALETDLRAAIESYLAEDVEIGALPSGLVERALARRSKDYGNQPTRSVTSVLPYIDFADSYQILNSHKSELPAEVAEPLREMAGRMQRVTEIRNRVAHSRPMEIDDLPFMVDVAKTLSATSGFSWHTLKVTMQKLEARPAYVLGLTIDLPADIDKAPQNNLPVPDFDETGFFGRQKELTRIKKAIKGAYPVISVLGEGGIGKTSIALKAAYELLDDPSQQFDAFVWVTAKATVLTTNEIQRINDAIEDSLGLFAQAASELGAGVAMENPVEEVLAYLEHFKILLILDNLETVLDQRLRDFLLDLPIGSKVIVTSRIGLGIENPISLNPLSSDASTKLLRALARTRGIPTLETLDYDVVQKLVQTMGGHPAYIKWFVAGVQSGRRPEEILVDNELLLDFCMSNVYDYLNDGAKSVLRAMQVLPGLHNQAELAFLTNFSANQIQTALLDLITTNFVQMHSQASSQYLETTYQLSDFGSQYLDKQHSVTGEQRAWFLNRSRELVDLGASLRAASKATPYDVETIDIRGPGDFNVARILRDAFREKNRGSLDRALSLCREAQRLAPGYHEAWRVEADIQVGRADYAAVLAAYERARELAPNSPTLNYFYGTFLLEEGGNPLLGLEILQDAARADVAHPVVITNIAWAQLLLKRYQDSLDAANHALTLRPIYSHDAAAATSIGLRAACYAAKGSIEAFNPEGALELIESATLLAENATADVFYGEPADRTLEAAVLAHDLRDMLDDDFMVRKASEFESRLREQLRRVDTELLERRLGTISSMVADKYYGFIAGRRRDLFFHLRDLVNEYEWDYLERGTQVAFSLDETDPRGPRAHQLRWLG